MQKYLRGHRVKIDDEMPPHMDHFPCGVEAIVDYSYSDAFGYHEPNCTPKREAYSLLLLGDDGSYSEPMLVAWYDQDQLTLVSDDRDAGERLLHKYKSRRVPK